ncbi:uncharacterized protein J3D65DRAFT_274838 [Phyllosticta citribraziliensis]|uniref:Uncharacterized protein n=1 Tax=Phyllosticta citribraziliensis TaxID=989973 RepID=A0ABR1LXC0_9PEZI
MNAWFDAKMQEQLACYPDTPDLFEMLGPRSAANYTRPVNRTKKMSMKNSKDWLTLSTKSTTLVFLSRPMLHFPTNLRVPIVAAREPLALSKFNVSLQNIVPDSYCILGASCAGCSFVGVLVGVAGGLIGSKEPGSFFRRRPPKLYTQLSSSRKSRKTDRRGSCNQSLAVLKREMVFVACPPFVFSHREAGGGGAL